MDKLKSSICFSCCFRCSSDADPLTPDHDPRHHHHHPSSLIDSSSTWIRSKAQEIPDIKSKCRGLVSRIGRNNNNGRRHHHQSADFRYDPFSYALNFDDGPDFDDDGEISPAGYRYRSFSSRLPPSPTKEAAAAAEAAEKAAAAAAVVVVPAKEMACS